MTTFSCVLIGNESLLVGCGDTLLEQGHQIRAVVTRDSAIADWATSKGLPVEAEIAALAARFGPGDFDWLLSIANLSIIPDAVLALPSFGSVNFHDGPLPRYAGLNAPAWAIMNRETQYGITWHMLEGGVDEGDILVQRLFDIAPDDTAFSLNSKCYAAAMDSFGDVVEQLQTGAPERKPQDLSQRSYCARDDRPAAAGRIDFTAPADGITALVRGLDFGAYRNPLSCPKIDVDGRIVLVGRADSLTGSSGGLPGTVLEHGPEGVVVATGSTDIRLSEFRTEHGEPLDLATLIEDGTRLPSPTADEAAALSQITSDCAPFEALWRRALCRMQPVDAPLSVPAEGNDWKDLRIVMPGALDEARLCAAVAAWALRSTSEAEADIALAGPSLQEAATKAPGYVSEWVPVHVARADALGALSDRIAAIASRMEKGGFALDLFARDPEILHRTTPAIGLALNGAGPIGGTCATVTVAQGRVTLHVNRTSLSEDATEILAQRLEATLKSVHDDTAATVSNLNILPDPERRQTLTVWNATATDYDRSLTVHNAFEQQVDLTPDATALVFEDQCLTYAALNGRANAVAARLIDMGVAPGVHVGLYTRRSLDLVVGALAILKAGGAYVPLDPSYPGDRIAHYITDSEASVIVTRADMRDGLPDSDAQLLLLDDATENLTVNADGGATADDLAYLIYTSGSTGTPKGVMVEHRNIANFFAGMDQRIDHERGGVWLAVTSLNFDISVLELFWTLARGFKVVLTSEENRAVVSNGPIAVSDRKIDFNLMYWGNDDGPGPKKYELLLEGAKFADANGFNAVWTPERHFHAFGGPYPNPSVTGAAVAAVTQNLSVRAGSCVAPLHHPARIAEEWAVIDNLTGGRAALGIASGWQPDDFVLRPENTPPANKPAMYEAIETLRKLWRGEAVEFPKKDGSMHSVVTQPRPVSSELPVWVTTAGNPETWKEAGEIGANVLTHLLGQSIEEVAGKIRIYHAALRENGHDPADFTVTLMLHTYLSDTRERAADVARGPMKDYLRAAAGLIKQYAWAFPAFKKPKGVSNPFEMDLGVLSESELEAILDFAFERYFEDSGLFGTVQDGLARIEQLKRIGVDEIACLIDYGIAPEVVLEGLKPLAEVLRLASAPSELADDDFSLAAQIIRHGVTHLQCTPSMARMIAMNDEARMALGRVRTLMLGGEALPGDLVEDLRECTGAQILNMYGPTETTIWSTTEAVGPGVTGTVDIGTPIANTSVYVLDADGQPAPIGVAGELAIGGEGVTRGYWQRAELTEERFRPDPFADEAGLTVPVAARMYLTGDMVRWRSDGKLDYLGRSDHQIKIRGQRIELGEIEAALAAVGGVTGAVVVARDVAPGDLRLIGYVTATGGVDEQAIQADLANQLPEAMVPSHIVQLDTFPLTPNKKIDRKALPAPQPRKARAQEAELGVDAPASSGVEAGIAAIWSRILGVADIRGDDNFFQLGGHSLLAVQAHREIRETLSLPDLSITDIFRFPTLAGLAGHIGQAAPDTPEPNTDTPAREETMSRRRAMRAGRQSRTTG